MLVQLDLLKVFLLSVKLVIPFELEVLVNTDFYRKSFQTIFQFCNLEP